MYLNLPEKICYTQEQRPQKNGSLSTFTLSLGPQTTKLVDLVINLYLSSEGQSSRPVKPKIQLLELTEKEGCFQEMIECVFLHLFYSKLVVISCLGQYRLSEKSSVVVLTHFQWGNCQMVCHLSQVSASKETLKRKTRKSLYSFLEESLSKIQSFKGALLFFPGCTRTYQPFCSPHHLGRMIQANAHGAQQFIDRAPGASQREISEKQRLQATVSGVEYIRNLCEYPGSPVDQTKE